MTDLECGFSPPRASQPVITQPIGGAAASRDSRPPPELVGNKDLEPIKIAVMLGRQELKMKVKQKEELAGPKVGSQCVVD